MSAANVRLALSSVLDSRRAKTRGLEGARTQLAEAAAALNAGEAVSLDAGRATLQLETALRQEMILEGVEQALERCEAPEELCTQLSALQTACASHVAAIRDVQSEAAAVTTGVEAIVDWTRRQRADNRLQRPGGPNSVLQERREKAEVMEEAEERAGRLLSRPEVADKDELRERLAKAQHDWWQLGAEAAEVCLGQVSWRSLRKTGHRYKPLCLLF